jgi:hypothetical protein
MGHCRCSWRFIGNAQPRLKRHWRGAGKELRTVARYLRRHSFCGKNAIFTGIKSLVFSHKSEYVLLNSGCPAVRMKRNSIREVMRPFAAQKNAVQFSHVLPKLKKR